MIVLITVWILAMIAVSLVGMATDYESITGIQFGMMVVGTILIGSLGLLNNL